MGWLHRRATDIVLVLVGALFIGIGLSLWYTQRPIEGGVVTTGRIVDHVTKTNSDNSRSTYPIIKFTDRYEPTHPFENDIGGSGFGVEGKIGQVVKVRYDPSHPSRAQWVDQPGRWVPPSAVAGGVAVWLVELGLVVRRLSRQWPLWLGVRGDESHLTLDPACGGRSDESESALRSVRHRSRAPRSRSAHTSHPVAIAFGRPTSLPAAPGGM